MVLGGTDVVGCCSARCKGTLVTDGLLLHLAWLGSVKPAVKECRVATTLLLHLHCISLTCISYEKAPHITPFIVMCLKELNEETTLLQFNVHQAHHRASRRVMQAL